MRINLIQMYKESLLSAHIIAMVTYYSASGYFKVEYREDSFDFVKVRMRNTMLLYICVLIQVTKQE
jgi:hypothetical protein